MNEKQKKVLIFESIVLMITLPIAIAGWYKFFKLANEFMVYEQKRQIAYSNDNTDRELYEKYMNTQNDNQEEEENTEEGTLTRLIKSIEPKESLNNSKGTEYLIVTLASSTCSHCETFK